MVAIGWTGHSCVVLISGGIICSGHNNNGQLGLGEPTSDIFHTVASEFKFGEKC